MRVKVGKDGEVAFDDALRFNVGSGEGVAVTFPDAGLCSVDLFFDLLDELVLFRASAGFDLWVVPADEGASHVCGGVVAVKPVRVETKLEAIQDDVHGVSSVLGSVYMSVPPFYVAEKAFVTAQGSRQASASAGQLSLLYGKRQDLGLHAHESVPSSFLRTHHAFGLPPKKLTSSDTWHQEGKRACVVALNAREAGHTDILVRGNVQGPFISRITGFDTSRRHRFLAAEMIFDLHLDGERRSSTARSPSQFFATRSHLGANIPLPFHSAFTDTC